MRYVVNVVDDTDTLEEALAAGGVVQLPPGVYRHSGLTIPADTSLIGSGPATVLMHTGTAATASIVPNGDNITISNLTLDNETASQVQGIRYAGGAVIDGLTVDSVSCVNHVALIRATNVTNAKVTNCTARLRKVSAWNGIMVSSGCSDWFISGNLVENASEEGISVDSANGITATDVVVTGNRVRGTGRTGIMVYRASRVTVSANIVSGVTGIFPGIASQTDNQQRNKSIAIVGNVISDCVADGIRVGQTDGATVAGNTVDRIAGTADNVYGSGIIAFSHASRVAITGNTVNDIASSTVSPGSAIAGIRCSASDSLVAGNVVSNVVNQVPVGVSGTRSVVANNVTV